MKQSIYSWLIFLAIIVCSALVAIFPSQSINKTPITIRQDYRVVQLRAFFEKHNCPKPYLIQDYLRVAEKYGLNYRLLPAIGFQEQSCWRAKNPQLNEFGVGSAAALHGYKNISQGMEEAAQILANPKKGLLHYGPKDNPGYPGEIEAIEKQIEN